MFRDWSIITQSTLECACKRNIFSCGTVWRQAFLQVHIKEEDRDALSFHWIKKDSKQIDALRITRALFGLVQSLLILDGKLDRI